MTEQQTLLSFVDDDVTNPFEDDLESDMENGLFDPTAYEEEEEEEDEMERTKSEGIAEQDKVDNPFD